MPHTESLTSVIAGLLLTPSISSCLFASLICSISPTYWHCSRSSCCIALMASPGYAAAISCRGTTPRSAYSSSRSCPAASSPSAALSAVRVEPPLSLLGALIFLRGRVFRQVRVGASPSPKPDFGTRDDGLSSNLDESRLRHTARMCSQPWTHSCPHTRPHNHAPTHIPSQPPSHPPG